MKSKAVVRFLLFVVLVAAVIPAKSIPTLPGPYVDDPPPDPGGYGSPNTPGGLCTNCAMFKCGCAPNRRLPPASEGASHARPEPHSQLDAQIDS